MSWDELKPIMLRKSHIQQYVFCPYAFKLMWEGKEPLSDVSLSIGKHFHSFANEFFDSVDLEIAEDNPLEYFKTLIPRSPPILRRLYENFVAFEAQRFTLLKEENSLDRFKPIIREQTLQSSKFALEGTIDRVDWFDTSSQDWVLIEYKTTRYQDRTSERRELAIYWLLMTEHYGFNTRYIGVFNPTINKYWTEPISPYTIEATKKRVEKILASLSTNEFPKRRSDKCVFCLYQEHCEA